MPEAEYSPERCVLCESLECSRLPTFDYDRGMWSDSRLSTRPLRKIVCHGCGLVRDGSAFSAEAIARHYGDTYELNAADAITEHQFFRNGNTVARSDAIAGWMADALAASDDTRGIRSVYEVGAGAGALLARFASIFPDARIAGCEPNVRSAAAARRRGLAVADGDASVLSGEHDLIVASFVLEHVPSPVAFLRQLAAHLSHSGRIVVAQPMQDVESHDIYFVDHLHHFATPHVEWIGNRAGLRQVHMAASAWFAANASVHVFERGAADPPIANVRSRALDSAIERWEKVFAACRALPAGRYALFGGSEFAGLLRCYGYLDRLDLVMVIDDVPERYAAGVFGLPVRALDAVPASDLASLDGVILALNPVYHALVTERCVERGIAVINPFTLTTRHDYSTADHR